jgi:hypothetical protein
MSMVLRYALAVSVVVFGVCACSARPQNNATETKAVKVEPSKTESNSIAGGVSKKDYELSISTSTEPKVGNALVATITLIPGAGLKVNDEFPHKIKLDALPAGVDCPKTELVKADAKTFTHERAEFEISCTAKEAGPKEFQGEYKLSVCTDSYCATPKEKIAWKFDVK